MTKKIFIIDDDQDVRDVLEYAISNEGYTVQTFENGEVALNALKDMPPQNYPGLLIVDYLMPVMDGISFIQEVMSDASSQLASIPIAFCSAMGELNASASIPKNVIRLQKPMELDDLLDMVNTHCL